MPDFDPLFAGDRAVKEITGPLHWPDDPWSVSYNEGRARHRAALVALDHLFGAWSDYGVTGDRMLTYSITDSTIEAFLLADDTVPGSAGYKAKLYVIGEHIITNYRRDLATAIAAHLAMCNLEPKTPTPLDDGFDGIFGPSPAEGLKP